MSNVISTRPTVALVFALIWNLSDPSLAQVSPIPIGATVTPQQGRTIRVTDNLDPEGWQAAPRLDHEGRFVAFRWFRQIWVKDLKTNTIRLASASSSGVAGNDYSVMPDISGSGRFVSFLSLSSNLVPGDDNGSVDVFVKDLETGQIEQTSISTEGVQANFPHSSLATISANGQFVAFTSAATNLIPRIT